MSHYTVMVRVSKETLDDHDGDLGDALAEMLAPFEESPKKGSPFLVFHDDEDEYRKGYETETIRRIRTPDGKLHSPYDARFRVPGTFGTGTGTHAVPTDCEEVEVPAAKLYPTFDAYAKDWHGSRKDKAKGRYGHWHNPNAKWDWYAVGGRWSGFFPLKPGLKPRLGEPGVFDNKPMPGAGDVVRVGDIDMDRVAKETREKAEKFFAEYEVWLADPSKKYDTPWDGPRRQALDIGLVRVEQKTVLAGAGEVAIPWAGLVSKGDNRSTWTDVAKVVERERFLPDYIDAFNPIVTYAALDADGWHAPGEMGWFGCSSDTPDASLAFHREFVGRFLKTAKPDDTLVVVDCHI